MKKSKRALLGLSIAILGPLFGDSFAVEQLQPYKDFLIKGTYEGQDFSYFSRVPKSRYDTFEFVFDYFEKNEGRVVVELGTTRSFVDGSHPGCNLDDPIYWEPNNPGIWDWGAGFFTRMASTCLSHLYPKIHTVDIGRSHIERCRVITSDYQELISYHVSSSEDFLRNFDGKIDLLYLDTGDMTPIETSAQLQLREAKIIVQRDLIPSGGIILIDDVRNTTPKKFGETSDYGKAKYSLAYLLENGYEMVMDEYQVVLRKL